MKNWVKGQKLANMYARLYGEFNLTDEDTKGPVVFIEEAYFHSTDEGDGSFRIICRTDTPNIVWHTDCLGVTKNRVDNIFFFPLSPVEIAKLKVKGHSGE